MSDRRLVGFVRATAVIGGALAVIGSAMIVDGTLSLTTSPGNGTTITGTIPASVLEEAAT